MRKTIVQECGTCPRVVKGAFLFTVFMILGGLTLILLPRSALAQDEHGLSIQSHASIVPASIPVGTSGVGITRLQFRSGDNDDTTSISHIEITLTGTLSDSDDIAAVNVYFEDSGGNLLFDNGTVDDVDAVLGGGPVTFGGGTTLDIDLDPNTVAFGWGGSRYLYIVFDFASDANSAETVGCVITKVTYGAQFTGTGGPGSPAVPPAHSGTGNVDDYEVTLTATGIAPAEAAQGDENVEILKLVFTAVDGSVTANIDSIELRRAGTGTDGDVAASGVTLYDDTGDTSGSYDSGDTAIGGGSGSLSGGYVLLNPTSNLQVASAGKTFFVTVNIAATAAVTKTVGIDVEDPSSDVVFVDVETDPDITTQYTQKGFITSSSATPESGNTVAIEEIVTEDVTPPTVTFTDPADGETDVLITKDIDLIFSEDMDASTVNTSSFLLKDSLNSAVSGTVNISGSNATFVPTSNLEYQETYTAMVTTAVQDLAGNPMAENYTWSFTVQDPPLPPAVTFTDPVDEERNVPTATDIDVIFSKDMDASTVNTSSFLLRDSLDNAVSGTVSVSGRNATFTPLSTLAYETTYIVTINTDALDLDGYSLTEDYVWSFTTIEYVPEPIAANNRILPGSTDPVKIYIPEPPGGPDERVTVQIFTVTGERIATLVNNTPYSQIVSSLPLLWYGKNQRQKNLGPGLYFIQIRTSSYKRVLKVLIVR